MKPTKRPAREKEARKTEKEGRRESEKKKSRLVFLNPKSIWELLLSAHAQTLQANIFCLD